MWKVARSAFAMNFLGNIITVHMLENNLCANSLYYRCTYSVCVCLCTCLCVVNLRVCIVSYSSVISGVWKKPPHV